MVLHAEAPELLALLQELKEKVVEIQERAVPVLDRVRAGQLPTDAGVTFLEVKYQVLLTYVTNIVFYLLLKAEGKPVREHPVMDQLHHVRCVCVCVRACVGVCVSVRACICVSCVCVYCCNPANAKCVTHAWAPFS